MNNTDTMTLSMMRDRYAEIHAELKRELERDMLWLRQDLESLERNSLGPNGRVSYSAQFRAELWNLKLEIIERCEGMDIDPQVYLSNINNVTF